MTRPPQAFRKLKGWANKRIASVYPWIVKTVRSFIQLVHKSAAGLKLKNTILFSSIPDFSESTVEVFDLIASMDEFKDYRLIWFCDYPKKHKNKRSARVAVKKRIDNPLFRLKHLYTESTSRFCVYTHQLLGNIHNESQVRIFIEHGSYGIKRGAGNVKHFDYSTYRVRTMPLSKPHSRICGLPRNDRLFDDPVQTKGKLDLLSFDKVFIWMPTFKHYQFKSMYHLERNDYAVEKDFDLTLQEDNVFYDIVDAELKKRNILLIIKYHPSQNMKYVVSKETENIKIIRDYELLAAGVKLYSLLGACDALITDFSSVAYDYLLVDKPIGFDITDLELYVQGGTVAVKDPLSHMPGEKITDVGTFRDFIIKAVNGEDNFAEERRKWLDKIHVHQDNQSAKRVVDLMLEHIL